MKTDRVIRISFIVCAVLVIVAFWAGYYFGNTEQNIASAAKDDTSDLYIESESDASETMTNAAGTTDQHSETDADDSDARNGSEKNDTSDSVGENTSESTDDIYFLRKNGSYLSVYQGDSDEVYFDTGLRISDLPEDIQEAAESGIAFDSLEELYGFLENYSS
ncbi:MAG: hypothetical protein LIO80_07895 [Lachnospiraceae bacterium]|nr:hypothetical protein [Lachnospiraceae bacterium]